MVGIRSFPIGSRPIFRGELLVSGRVQLEFSRHYALDPALDLDLDLLHHGRPRLAQLKWATNLALPELPRLSRPDFGLSIGCPLAILWAPWTRCTMLPCSCQNSSPVFSRKSLGDNYHSKNPKNRNCVDAGCWTSILMSWNSPAICKIPSSTVPAAVSS